jgi:hypothetical protein
MGIQRQNFRDRFHLWVAAKPPLPRLHARHLVYQHVVWIANRSMALNSNHLVSIMLSPLGELQVHDYNTLH